VTDDAAKSARHSLAAFSRWAKTDPTERQAQMSELGKASAAKRKAAREAAGLPEPRRRSQAAPLPSAEELAPYLEAVDAQPRETPLSYDLRYREATLHLRLDIAAQTVAAIKRSAAK